MAAACPVNLPEIQAADPHTPTDIGFADIGYATDIWYPYHVMTILTTLWREQR